MTTQPTRQMRAPTRMRVRPAPLWWRDAAGIALWASLLLVVVLWLSGGGLRALAAGLPQGFISAGRITGLVAADLLLVQVLFMARVPWIERSYGQDELARRHRLVGFWSFNLLLSHVILTIFGYALTDHNDVVHETWTMLTTYGGMLLAGVGTAALALVTVTSIRLARRVLRYESWHLLHLYSYVGIALTIPHEVWTGSDFAKSSFVRDLWWGANVLAAIIVVVWRVGLPLARNLRHRISVSSVIRESQDVVTVTMTGRKLDRLPVQAGQFFIWRFLNGPGWTRGNPYSLSAAPGKNRMQITAKALGDGSSSLRSLRPGTKVLIEGPFGRLTAERRSQRKVAMFACGIGITPMRALLEELDYAPGDATLVYRARNPGDVVFRAELDGLAHRRGVEIYYLTGARNPIRQSWLPSQAERISEHAAMRKIIPDIAERDVFVCGPDQWMAAVSNAAFDAGLPEARLHLERFAW